MSSTISSSSLYSVSTANSGSQGIAGLMSGMDTEAMVKKMLSGTQSQIDAQDAKRQQTEWKQEIYRDVISSINSFRNKFFDTGYGSSAANNLASPNFFNTMLSTVKSGNALRVVSTDYTASTGDFRVAVKQLASQAVLNSAKKVSGEQKITGSALDTEALTQKFAKSVTLMVNGTEVNVELGNVTTEQGMTSAFQNALTEKGITGVTAKIFDGKLRLVTDSADTSISVSSAKSTALGLSMTGLDNATVSNLSGTDGAATGKKLQGDAIDLNAGYSFDLTLDGVKKTITISNVAQTVTDGKTTITPENIRDAMQEQVKKAFGDYLTVELSADNKLSFAIDITNADGEKEVGHELTVTGADSKVFGITPGATSHINTATSLKDLGLTGDRFKFTINGTEFTFSGDDTVSSVINAVNNSNAGVTLSYSSISDTFSMKASSTGAKYGIELSQQEGDLLGTMFGQDVVHNAAKATGSILTTDHINGKAGGLSDDYSTESVSMTMNVNGKDYTFSLPKEEDVTYNKTVIESELNRWLGATFGTNSQSGSANISYQDGKLSIAEGYTVKFAATKVDTDKASAVEEAQKTDLALALGFNTTAKSNIASSESAVSEIYQLKNIDPSLIKKADGTAAATLADIASIDGNTMSFSDGRMLLSGSGTIDLSGNAALSAMFGKESIALGDGGASAAAVTAGKDAVILVDGVETSRSSNVFELDGITMELTQTSAKLTDAAGNVTGYEETTISTARDADTIVNGFKSFVEEYNKMVEKLNKLIDEDPEYRSYPPLTSDQREGMTDSQIKLWEEKTKVGLVHNDSAISSFLSEMRIALYTKPAGSKVALYDIGIETMSSYDDADNMGKLQMDEATLRSALAADPDSVRNLFTDASDGLAQKLVTAMKRTANTSSGSPGELVQTAGVKGTATDKNNTMYDQITNIKNRISDLKDKYDRQKTRYWKQFSSMETIMANYNSQSMAISQQFSL